MDTFMEIARQEARRGMQAGEGGPFGAVIVKDGRVIASAHNQVLKTHDATAHAEISAIRQANEILGTHDLSGCEIFTTCYPCPMCFSALLWARIKTVWYGCTAEQAAKIGFDDQAFYKALRNPGGSKLIRLVKEDDDGCLALFDEWQKLDGRQLY
jgi:guanine deaminase